MKETRRINTIYTAVFRRRVGTAEIPPQASFSSSTWTWTRGIDKRESHPCLPPMLNCATAQRRECTSSLDGENRTPCLTHKHNCTFLCVVQYTPHFRSNVSSFLIVQLLQVTFYSFVRLLERIFVRATSHSDTWRTHMTTVH